MDEKEYMVMKAVRMEPRSENRFPMMVSKTWVWGATRSVQNSWQKGGPGSSRAWGQAVAGLKACKA
eukprot:1156674-Pelagomonas_calceolata.AAC.15